MGILEKHLIGADAEKARAAKAALKKLEESGDPDVANRAKAALFSPQLRAIGTLEQLGAGFTIKSDRVVGINLDSVENLKASLHLLREFPDLEDVSLSNRLVDDDVLTHLKGLSKLTNLNLY